MTIRTKLLISINALLIVTIGLLGAGVFVVSTSLYRRDAGRMIDVIENSVQRAAQDAMLQKDDLMLVSYCKFLRTQYPALAYASIRWQDAARTRDLTVSPPDHHRALTLGKTVRVADPADASRRVIIQLGIDLQTVYQVAEIQRRRLAKVIILVATTTILLGSLFSYLFSRSLTAPLRSMVQLASDIGAGKLGGRLEWSSKDELGSLVMVFNRMSQRLEELDETKKNFISSVTHELRSPLGAIDGFLFLIDGALQKGSAKDLQQCRTYLERIQVNVQRLSRFISDLLDIAKIEKGKMECVLRPMRVQDVALEVCQFFEAKAKQQGVQLTLQMDHLPQVMGDPDRLRQVLINLVSNSLKFTPGGGEISIAGTHDPKTGPGAVEVAVADTGRGIDERDQGRLFESFAQGRNVADGVIGNRGTGLGLYICKSIVTQHGGTIAIQSARGKGTRTFFTLKTA